MYIVPHSAPAALAAGALWGTMYIPYRKAYLTGMHPLSFVAFFTIGELGMMTALAVTFSGGPGALWERARPRSRDSLLVAPRRVRLGRGRPVPAVCRQVRGHQPRHPAVEHEPALGPRLGDRRVRRAQGRRSGALRAGDRRFAPHGRGRGRDRARHGARPG